MFGDDRQHPARASVAMDSLKKTSSNAPCEIRHLSEQTKIGEKKNMRRESSHIQKHCF